MSDTDYQGQSQEGTTTNQPNAPEEVKKQWEEVDKKLEKLNADNEEGHAKNMATAEAEAEASKKAMEDEKSAHRPTGKQWNRNTPRVNKDGTKSWVD